MPLQPERIPRRVAAAALAGLLAAAAGALAAPAWRDAPEHVRLFAPAAHLQRYRAWVTAADLDAVLEALDADPSLVRAPGAWAPRAEAATDAFGRSGSYDRWKLARLYGGRQVRVARGVRLGGGRAAESWTLISPYPAPDLSRLESGTLRIVLGIAP
jgi:hypothetical protein